MSGIDVARTVVENYRDELRIASEALHHANNRIKFLEKQVQDYQKINSVLEDRIRSGSNTALEEVVHQKNLTIKHLELQVQKALKQNEELTFQLSVAESKRCPCCQTSISMGVPDRKTVQKSTKCAKQNANKKVDYADRQLRLERIIEHKDERIIHLSKEVKKLTKIEKELNNKIYRISKLLPMSVKSSDELNPIYDCLLKEIQSLESQIQLYKDKNDKIGSLSGKTTFNDAYLEVLKSKENIPNGSKHISLSETQQRLSSSTDDKAISRLHSLYEDIGELKHVFLKENEKFQQILNREQLRRDVLKVEWADIINKLNYIAETIHNIIKTHSLPDNNASDYEACKDKVISQLQQRLKDNLDEFNEYQTENECLRRKVADLNEKLLQFERDKRESADKSVLVEKDMKSPSNSNLNSADQSDLDKLKELFDVKAELKSAHDLIKFQANFISQLQNGVQTSNNHQYDNLKQVARQSKSQQTDIYLPTINSETDVQKSSKAKSQNLADIQNHVPNSHNMAHQAFEVPSISSNESSDSCTSHSSNNDKKIKSLEMKLNVSEKSIKSLEDLIEHIQHENTQWIEKNRQLSADYDKAKSENSLLAKTKDVYSSQKMRLNIECDEIKKENHALQDKIVRLEKENKNLEEKLLNCKREDKSKKSLIQNELDEANNHNESLERIMAELQNEVLSLKEENDKLKSSNLIAEYKENISSLKRKLARKENEVDNLKKDLQALETQAQQMNSHRRSFRTELKKLCDTLTEESDINVSSAQSKAVYKAAIIRSAKALLELDMNDENDADSSSIALDEMKHQVIYLTELKRITELLSIKDQQRDELLRKYINDGLEIVDDPLTHERNFSGSSFASDVESAPIISTSSSAQSIPVISTASGVPSIPVNSTIPGAGSIPVISTASGAESIPVISTSSRITSMPPVSSTISGVRSIPIISTASGVGSVPSVEHIRFSPENLNAQVTEEMIQTEKNNIPNYNRSMTEIIETLQKDLHCQRNVTAFFISRCKDLEQQLKSEQDFRFKYERNNEAYEDFIREFKSQLKERDHRINILEKQLAKLQSEKSNVEITLEQQKSEIEWLVNENKRLLEKVRATEAELCKSKDENSRILNDIGLLKRELVNEKYAYAKVENEVKHLHEHIAYLESKSSND